MYNPHTKCEMSTITCNEDMKSNAKSKTENSGFEPPFDVLGVTHRVHLWLDEKLVVDFLYMNLYSSNMTIHDN